jgi:hypothetical protein
MIRPIAPAPARAGRAQPSPRLPPECETEVIPIRSHRWRGTAALLGVIPAFLIPSTSLSAQDTANGQEKAAVPTGAHLRGPGQPRQTALARVRVDDLLNGKLTEASPLTLNLL